MDDPISSVDMCLWDVYVPLRQKKGRPCPSAVGTSSGVRLGSNLWSEVLEDFE